MQILALTTFSVLSHFDLDLWSTDLQIKRINGRGTLYRQAKFHWNSLNDKRENSVQQICQGIVLMILTFNLRPLSLNELVPLVIYYRRAKFMKDRVTNNREIADCAFFLSSATLWPWPLTFASRNVYSCSASYYLSSGKIWERYDEKW